MPLQTRCLLQHITIFFNIRPQSISFDTIVVIKEQLHLVYHLFVELLMSCLQPVVFNSFVRFSCLNFSMSNFVRDVIRRYDDALT